MRYQIYCFLVLLACCFFVAGCDYRSAEEKFRDAPVSLGYYLEAYSVSSQTAHNHLSEFALGSIGEEALYQSLVDEAVDGNARPVMTTFLRLRSGQRANINGVESIRASGFLKGQEVEGPTSWRTIEVGDHVEMDPIIGADDYTLEVSIDATHRVELPSVEIPIDATNPRRIVGNSAFYFHGLKSVGTMTAGFRRRLIGHAQNGDETVFWFLKPRIVPEPPESLQKAVKYKPVPGGYSLVYAEIVGYGIDSMAAAPGLAVLEASKEKPVVQFGGFITLGDAPSIKLLSMEEIPYANERSGLRPDFPGQIAPRVSVMGTGIIANLSGNWDAGSKTDLAIYLDCTIDLAPPEFASIQTMVETLKKQKEGPAPKRFADKIDQRVVVPTDGTAVMFKREKAEGSIPGFEKLDRIYFIKTRIVPD